MNTGFSAAMLPGTFDPRFGGYGPQLSEGLASTLAGLDWQKQLVPKQQQFAAQQAAADRAFQGGQADAQRAFAGSQAGLDRTQAMQLSLAPLQQKNQRWDQIFPLVQGVLGNINGAAGGSRVGGENTPQPTISAAPVWSQGQIDQQVNSQKANNATAAATQSRDAANKTAGSGFGANSPLLQALQGQIEASRMGADAAAQRETNWGAAQGNAQQLLASQQAQEGQWKDYNTADIARRQQNMSYVTSLASVLSSLL